MPSALRAAFCFFTIGFGPAFGPVASIGMDAVQYCPDF